MHFFMKRNQYHKAQPSVRKENSVPQGWMCICEAVTTSGPPWFLLLPFSVSSYLPASFPSPLPLPPPLPLPLPTLWHPFHPLNLFCRRLYLSSFILSTPYTSSAAAASAATYPKSCPHTSNVAAVSAATYLIPCPHTSSAAAATASTYPKSCLYTSSAAASTAAT